MPGPSGRAPLPPGTLRHPRDLAPLIDHTLLRPGASEQEVERWCEEALRHGFAGVCVRGGHLPLVVRRLAGSAVLPVAVADFPRGAGTAAARLREVEEAAAAGAREIDVVAPLAALHHADWPAVHRDLAALARAAGGAALKVILETCLLPPGRMAAGAAVAAAAGAAFVKTSTGFSTGGATEEAVRILREAVGPAVGVKASGGIRTAAAALRMVQAGASRIGCSASVALVEAPEF